MSADKNKTDLTHDVTEAAAKWLASIGAKCIETEVRVGPKWIADLAAFWTPTMTEAAYQKLVPRRSAGWDARLAAFRALPRIITIVVEVKTSMPDFKRDLGEKFARAPVADLQILAVPHSLISIESCPPKWWILGVDLEKPDVDVWRPVGIVPTSLDQRLDFVAAVGERRHNRTHNEFWSALGKRRRDEERQRREMEAARGRA